MTGMKITANRIFLSSFGFRCEVRDSEKEETFYSF